MIKKICNKFTGGVKASIWFTICSIVQKGVQFITVPFFTRLLTIEEYGEFSLYQSWLSIILIIGSLNLFYGCFNNGMLKYENDRDSFISSLQGLSMTASLILIVIFLTFRNSIEYIIGMSETSILMILMEVLFYPCFMYWTMKQRFEYKYKDLVLITIGIAILNPILGFVLVKLWSEHGMARIFSVSIINILIGAFFCLKNYNSGKTLYNKEYWIFALKFNMPLIPHYLSSIVLAQADRIMIGVFFGNEEVAIYSIAYSIGMIMNIIVQSVNASLTPWIYRCCKGCNYSQVSLISKKLLLLIGGSSLVPILIAPEIMSVMGPSEYKIATWCIPPISIGIYFTFLYSLFANIEFYYEKSIYIMIASCFTALNNIILNYIFMKRFGFIAAAYTTLVCYILLAVIHYIFMKIIVRHQKIYENIYDIRDVVLISCGVVVISFVCMLLFDYSLVRYGIIIIILCMIYLNRVKLIKIFLTNEYTNGNVV